MRNRCIIGLLILFALLGPVVWAKDCPKDEMPVEPALHTALTRAKMEMEKGRNQKALDFLADYSSKNTAKPHPQLPFLKGIIQYRLKRFQESEILFKEAIRLNPCFGEAWQNLAVLYYREKRYVPAAEAMAKAFSLISPENRDLQYQAAVLLVHAKKPSLALPLLKDLAAKPKAEADWLGALSVVYDRLAQPARAARAMEKAIRLKPDAARQYQAALLWVKAGRPEKALPLLKALCAKPKVSSQWRATLVHVLERLGKNEEAAKVLAQGKAGEGMPAQRFRSALLYLKEGSPQKALPILRGLAETANPAPQWLVVLASTLDQLERPKEASAAMEMIDPSTPSLSAQMRLQMAIFWLHHHHPKRALPLLNALANDPHASKACLTAQIEALIQTGKPKAADIPLNKLLDRYPQDEKIWRLAAWTAIEQKAYGKAVAALEVAFRMSPPQSGDWKRLGNLYRLAGVPQKAAEAYIKAFGKEPTAEELDLMAYTYQEAHQTDKALKAAARAAKRKPSAKRFSRLGQLYMAQENCAKGMEAFQKAAQLDDSGGVNSLRVGYAAWKLDRLACAKTAFQSALQKADATSQAASKATRALKTIEKRMKRETANSSH